MTKASPYDVILSPVVTEKSTALSEQDKLVFRVARHAKKTDIKEAVRSLFGVEVLAVNTLLRKGKVKRFRGRKGQRSDTKKAIVTLKPGQFVDVTAGV